MAGPFDADDFMRRSFFNSIIGYKGSRKIVPVFASRGVSVGYAAQLQPNCRGAATTAPSTPLLQLQPQQTAFSAPPSVTLPNNNNGFVTNNNTNVAHDVMTPLERTELDIYREIVCECAEIEKSTQCSPSSTDEPRSPQLCHHCHCEKAKKEADNCRPVSISPPQNATVSLEDFVKLVVTAVRESGVVGLSPKSVDLGGIPESPEVILQRKRQQNNEAAARYRKRQRAAKEIADGELQELEEKNKELKETVERMQEEIDRLKSAVLGKHKIESC